MMSMLFGISSCMTFVATGISAPPVAISTVWAFSGKNLRRGGPTRPLREARWYPDTPLEKVLLSSSARWMATSGASPSLRHCHLESRVMNGRQGLSTSAFSAALQRPAWVAADNPPAGAYS